MSIAVIDIVVSAIGVAIVPIIIGLIKARDRAVLGEAETENNKGAIKRAWEKLNEVSEKQIEMSAEFRASQSLSEKMEKKLEQIETALTQLTESLARIEGKIK